MLIRIARVTSKARRDERGVALAAVIGVMAVALLVMTLVTTSIVTGLGRTTATRASVQSQAAAQAGIAATRALVDSGACAGVTNSSETGTTPKYRVSVSWRASDGGTWNSTTCPTTAAVQIRYISTGTAAAGGVAGQSASNSSTIESVYGAKSVTSPITGSGAAIYSWGSTVSGASGIDGGVGLLCTLGCASKATIQVRHGNATCASLLGITSLNITADWMIEDGSFIDTGCDTINGNVSASGQVSMSGTSSITGNVSAGTLTMSDSSRITADLGGNYGNAWVTGSASLNSAPLLGALANIDKNLTAKAKTGSGRVGGTFTAVPSGPGPSPYVTARVPDWAEYQFTGISGWPGFALQTLTAATCNSDGLAAAKQAFGTSKGVIDARACTAGLTSAITLGVASNDIALILPNTINFNLGLLSVSLGSKNLWIVQSDGDVTDGVPTCPAGGGITLAGASITFPHIMVYTPCTYSEAGLLSISTFTGQIYAGKVSLKGTVRVMNYQQIGLPGVDLTAGTSTATGRRELISSRNVQAGAGG